MVVGSSPTGPIRKTTMYDQQTVNTCIARHLGHEGPPDYFGNPFDSFKLLEDMRERGYDFDITSGITVNVVFTGQEPGSSACMGESADPDIKTAIAEAAYFMINGE